MNQARCTLDSKTQKLHRTLRALCAAVWLATPLLGVSSAHAENSELGTDAATPEAALPAAASSPTLKVQQEAGEWFERGQTAYANHEYAEAAFAFEQAHARVPHGATAYNAAVAWEAADRDARAANAYYLALLLGDLRDNDRTHAEESLRRLSLTLGLLGVSCPSRTLVSVDGGPFLPCPFETFVHPGPRELAIAYEGGRTERVNALAVAGQREQFTLQGKTIAKRQVITASVQPTRPFPWHYVVIGGAGLLAAGGLTLGTLGLEARNDFRDSGRTDVGLRQRAVRFRTFANLAYAGSVVLGATGAVLWFYSGSQESVQGSPVASQATGLRSRFGLGVGTLEYQGVF